MSCYEDINKCPSNMRTSHGHLLNVLVTLAKCYLMLRERYLNIFELISNESLVVKEVIKSLIKGVVSNQ